MLSGDKGKTSLVEHVHSGPAVVERVGPASDLVVPGLGRSTGKDCGTGRDYGTGGDCGIHVPGAGQPSGSHLKMEKREDEVSNLRPLRSWTIGAMPFVQLPVQHTRIQSVCKCTRYACIILQYNLAQYTILQYRIQNIKLQIYENIKM